jgi:hypothetical protein
MTVGDFATPTQRQRRFMREKSRRPWPKLDFSPRQNDDFRCASASASRAMGWAPGSTGSGYGRRELRSERLGDDALGDTGFVNSTFGCPDILSTDLPSGGPCYPCGAGRAASGCSDERFDLLRCGVQRESRTSRARRSAGSELEWHQLPDRQSRGHFRGGFDEFFGPEQIVEVDLPGLTSPMLSRFTWSRLPRPVIPLDENVEWRAASENPDTSS